MQRQGPENPQFNMSEQHEPGRKIVRSLIEGLAQQEEATTFVQGIVDILSDPIIAEKLFYLLPLKNSLRKNPQVDPNNKELIIGFQGHIYPTDFGRGSVVFSFKDDQSRTPITRVSSYPLQESTPEAFQREIDEVLIPTKDLWQITSIKRGHYNILIAERPFSISDIVSEASRVRFFTEEIQGLADDIYTAATRVPTPMQYRRLINVFAVLKQG